MGLRSFITWLAAPPETKYRLDQQHLDVEAAKMAARVLATPGLSVTLRKAVDNRQSGPPLLIKASSNSSFSPPKELRSVYSNARARADLERWYTTAEIAWDGTHLNATGNFGRPRSWQPVRNGLRPGTDAAEVFQTRQRATASGECPTEVAAMATVGMAGYLPNRVCFLDEESRELSWFSMVGFIEDDMMRIAAAAGIAYRSYTLAMGGFSAMNLTPDDFCEALFPPNATRTLLVSYDLHKGWWWRRPVARS